MKNQKQSFRIVCELPGDRYEKVIGQCFLLGMQGNDEEVHGERIMLRVYFADQPAAEVAADELRKVTGIVIDAVEPVEQQDWLAKWRESMKPARLADGFWVSPLWLPPPASAEYWIKIEPKMAFGTGHHETTRLAAAAIIAERSTLQNRTLLDIGTGSGVLCFTADACGAGSCLGVEIDPQCRENLAENRHDNAAKGRVSFIAGPIDALVATARFDCIVMNMLITESAPLLNRVATLATPGGTLIWSGILAEEAAEATGRAGRAGFLLRTVRRENEWWCGTFIKST
jgi:ribosomal protein L11 methyltransferase